MLEVTATIVGSLKQKGREDVVVRSEKAIKQLNKQASTAKYNPNSQMAVRKASGDGN